MARDFAPCLGVVVHPPEMIAIRHGSESSIQRQNFQAMTWKVEIANDLRPQQRNYIRANRELKPRHDLFGHGGATKHMAALQQQNFFSGACQVGGVHQAVVAAANHNYVVVRV